MSQCHCLSISLLSLFTAHMYFLRTSRPGQWRNGKAREDWDLRDLTQISLVFSLFFELFRNYHTVFNHASFCMVNAWNRLIPINRRNKGNKWSRDQVPGIAKYGKKNKLLFFSKFLFLCLLPVLLVPFLIPVLLKKCCLEIMKKTIPVLIITHRMLKLRMIWSATHSTRLLYSKVGAWQKHLLTSLSVNMADIYLLSSEKLHNESLCATMKTWPEQCQNYPQKTKYDQNFLKRKNDCKLWRAQNIENIIN